MIVNFQKKLLKENGEQRTQLTCRRLKLLINKNFQSYFNVTLGIRTIKPTWWNTYPKNGEKVFTLLSNQLFGNPWWFNRLRNNNFCLKRVGRVIIVLPDSDVAVISLYRNVTNFTLLDALWFKTSTDYDKRYILIQVLVSELRLPKLMNW